MEVWEGKREVWGRTHPPKEVKKPTLLVEPRLDRKV
jgi:hypothetical protein